MTLTFKEFLNEEDASPTPPKREPLPFVPGKLTDENIKKWEETMLLLRDRMSYTLNRHPGPHGKRHAPKTYVKSPEAFNRDYECIGFAKKIVAAAPAMDKILKKYYKLRLKNKITMSDTAVEDFKEVQAEWKEFIYSDKVDISKMLRITKKLKGYGAFHATKDILDSTIGAINFMADIREEMADVMKRAGRTDAQNARADKASAAMRARWAAY